MKTSVGILAIILLSTMIIFGQTNNKLIRSATLCGKIGQGGPAPLGNYTIAELKDCDLKIIPIDTSLTVTKFKLSLIHKDKSERQENEINGNQIPEEFKTQILSSVKNVYIEYIIATDKKGNKVPISPIAIRVIQN